MGNQIFYSNEDTIAAVSTAYGEGGIGIVRISGPEALSVLGKLFRKGRFAATEEVDEAVAKGRDCVSVIGDAKGVAIDAGDASEDATAAALVFEDRHMYYGHVIDPASGE
ncbi:MAG: hypothetical protein II456_03475, partial [Firmicutes bacterium]|nr:hypothetical protein [Bacillota bacterium]